MTFDCTQARAWLAAHGDSEKLDAVQEAQLREHLAHCAACSAQLQAQCQLGDALRQHAGRFRAPDTLRARLARQVAHAPARTRWNLQTVLRYAGAFAAGLVLALGLQVRLAEVAADDRLTDEVVAGHVRSLMVAHLSDVISTDQHTVKPWFNGKLDFAPPVNDFAAIGFPLVGGRLDYVDQHETAALVYKRRQHTINLFVWPGASASRAAQATQRHGYSLVHWQDRGMNFWAVSDLNADELMQFARAAGAG